MFGVFILLGVYWASRIFSLVPVINFGKCSAIIYFKHFFCSFLSFFHFWYFYYHMLYILWLSYESWIFRSIFFNLFFFFLHFSYRSFYWHFFKLADSFLNHTKSVDELIKFLLQCFSFLLFPLIFLEFSSLCLHYACSFVLFTYSIRALSLY